MATASNNHRLAAVMRALDLPSRMPPNARLWLALASTKCNSEGQTNYTPEGYSADANDTINSGNAAIQWLLAAGLITNDTNDDGNDCYRLTHYDDWNQTQTSIGGYSEDRLSPRDGHPPAYGRPVHAVITPPTGNLNYTPPTWNEIAQTIHPNQDQDQ